QTANEVPRFGPMTDGAAAGAWVGTAVGTAGALVGPAPAAGNVIVSRDVAIARRTPTQPENAGETAVAGETLHFQVAAPFAGRAAASVDERVEDLGEQVLEGVVTRGTRRTQTIPAGAIGN